MDVESCALEDIAYVLVIAGDGGGGRDNRWITRHHYMSLVKGTGRVDIATGNDFGAKGVVGRANGSSIKHIGYTFVICAVLMNRQIVLGAVKIIGHWCDR